MTIEELIERLVKSEGGSRDLDGAIEVEARRQVAYSLGLSDETRAKWEHSGGTVYDPDTIYDAPAYTASIDAAVALAEKVLKVYRLDICMDPSGESAKIVWWPKGLTENETTIKSEGLGWSAALSICIAILKAKHGEQRP